MNVDSYGQVKHTHETLVRHVWELEAQVEQQAVTIEQYRLFIREMDEVLRYSCWSERVQRLRAAITDVPYPLERLPMGMHLPGFREVVGLYWHHSALAEQE